MAFIYNWVEDKISGYAKTGIQAGGTLAGNTVGSVGGLVESSGQSVANGVTGSIGGVANYINGYGDTIKRSMSSDGPTSSANKKTAVKPNAPTAAAKKPPPSAPKALPAAGQKKALPAPPQKPRSPAPATGGAKKPPTAPRQAGAAAKPATGGRPASQGKQLNKLTSTPSQSQSGKVVISSASRPKPKTASTPSRGVTNAPQARPKDPLGIEGKGSGNKSGGGGGNQRKSSAADPLAIGKDFGQFGKK